MAEFEALIKGRADLNDAQRAFDTFKKQMETPIQIKFDTSGLKIDFASLQKQAQQNGIQIGNSLAQGLQKTIRGAKVGDTAIKAMFDGVVPDSKMVFNGSALESIGTYSQAIKNLKKELQDLEKGGLLKGFRFGEDGKSFTADITNGINSTIKVVGTLGDILNDQGEIVGHRWQTNQTYVVDYTNSIRQAQKEAETLALDVERVGTAFNNGTFDANIATMTKQLSEVSDTVNRDLVQKAQDAANEYKRITDEIATSIKGTSSNPLVGQDLVDAYKKSTDALQQYGNAMKEVRADTTKMFAEGANFRAANDVEAWAKKNSKALSKYGEQLEQLKQQMRSASSAGELASLQNQFKNLKAEANALGLTGLSFGDQLKRAFVRIGEFTGIYAITSKVRQAIAQIPQEVIKIDTAMTELRKVSTATASELSDYFDNAADSAYKYGQAIDEIIDSTASWTRLGYDLNDAKILTDVTAELAQVGSGLNVDTATEGLQATIRGFGLMAEDAKRVGDTINAVADASPIDALGIINGLERSSAVLNEMNNSLEETIGLITATTSVTQDASSAGTAWRTNKTVRVYRNMHGRTHLKPVKPKASLLQCG